jgi:DNA-binding Lrp family transcriptional regulator
MYSQLSEVDRKMLKLLLESEGRMHTREISQQLGITLSTANNRRKRLERDYIVKDYSLDPIKFGWRKIDLLNYTVGGGTIDIGKGLLKREEVTYVARALGEHSIDLRVEVHIKDNDVLLNLLEDVEVMKGVRDVVWTEVVETIGRKNSPNHILI